MKGSNILGYATVAALATGAAVIGQNQPAGAQPGSTQPGAIQPSRPTTIQPATTQPGQPGRIDPGQETRWREMAARIQDQNERMNERTERLAQRLAQAQTQTGEARVNALAEVLTGVLEEHQHINRSITRLQRMVFRSYMDSTQMSDQWESWKQQYPFLDETRDADEMDNTRPSDADRPNTAPGRTPATQPTDPIRPR